MNTSTGIEDFYVRRMIERTTISEEYKCMFTTESYDFSQDTIFFIVPRERAISTEGCTVIFSSKSFSKMFL